MKNQAKILWSAALLASAGLSLPAQNFDCGSDGSYGPLNITADTTLDLSPDGIFKCTTINVAGGATLRFNRNPLNTPVYLLATGNATINGTVDVSGTAGSATARGLGGPGGFDGGNPRTTVSYASAGFGPGAAPVAYSGVTVGFAAYATTATGNPGIGSVYGSPLLVPLVGGSGGGGYDNTAAAGYGGYGGGGAVLIASNTRIDVGGTIRAQPGNGNAGNAGAGSGGAIRLVAPVVAGNGTLNVFSGGAGHGRVRLDGFERSATFSYAGVPSASISGGAFMTVFPPARPRLDVVEAAGTPIALNTPSPVSILLPLGSTTNRTVKVRGENFGTAVPIRVVLTPAEGERIVYSATLDNAVSNPATNTVNVVVPANVIVTVNAWTQ